MWYTLKKQASGLETNKDLINMVNINRAEAGYKKPLPDPELYKRVGGLSSEQESRGGSGVISTGKRDVGGKSYGMFQLQSDGGMSNSMLGKFLAWSGFKKYFDGLMWASDEFDAKWKSITASNPGFVEAQKRFLYNTHFMPVYGNVANKYGLNSNNTSPVVWDVIFSMSVQHGKTKSIVDMAFEGKSVARMSDADKIKALYGARIKYVSGLNIDDKMKKTLVEQRYVNEMNDALAKLKSTA